MATAKAGAGPRKTGALSPLTLLCYSAPGVPGAMVLYAVGVVIPGFYAGAVGLSAAAIGMVLLVTRLGDVAFDFGAGALSDLTHTRLGRRKPWLAAGAAVVAAAFALQMIPPRMPWPHGGVTYFLVTSVAFYLGWSLFIVPFDAWGSELAADYDARSRLFTWRAAAGYVGSLLFCALPALPIFKSTEFSPEVLRFAALLVAILLAITVPLAIVAAPTEPPAPRKRPDFRGVLSAIRFNRPLRIYVVSAVLNGLSDGLFTAVVFIFQAVYMGFARQMWLILIVYIGANFLALPVWEQIALRIGKHRAWAIGLALTAICYPPMALLKPGPASFLPMLILVALAGATYSIANVATPAVLGDVVDYETLKSRSGKAGSLFALQALISKFNIAVGAGLGFLIIGVFGFDAAQTAHTPKAIFGLQLAHLYLPSALKFVAIGLIWRFPLDQRTQSIIRRRLDQLAARAAL